MIGPLPHGLLKVGALSQIGEVFAGGDDEGRVEVLGVENDNETLVRGAFGWGESLSGAWWFNLRDDAPAQDAIFYSATYGEGISHYIVDTRAQLDNGAADAVLDTSGNLVPLPLLAWKPKLVWPPAPTLAS